MVYGFDMDMLFTREQVAPTTAPPTTGSDTNLASIATSMSSFGGGNVAQLADNDKEETIYYNNMPQDIHD